MGLGKDIYDIGKDINTARREYMKTHAKDDYIALMESQLDQLMKMLEDLNSRIEEYEHKPSFVLNDDHLFLLHKIKVSPSYRISKNVLINGLSDTRQVALAELEKHNYIKLHTVDFFGGIYEYSFSNTYKAEILTALLSYSPNKPFR